jgi:hypothetical protein
VNNEAQESSRDLAAKGERELERKIARAFYGECPQCQCCGERNAECTWRPAYQMMLCPECPKRNQ